MNTFLAVISMLSQLVPLVPDLVKSIEAAFPATDGTSKLGALESLLSEAFNAIEQTAVSFEQIWPALSSFVSKTVAIFNATGIFTHAAATVSTVASTITVTGGAVDTLANTITSVSTDGTAPTVTPVQAMVPISPEVTAPTVSPFLSVAASLPSSAP